MKKSVLFSILMHALFFTALIVMPSRSRSLPRTRTVYEVELVSAPRLIEEAPKKAEVRPPVRPPDPAPVVPKKKPKKETRDASVEVEKKETSESLPVDSAEIAGSIGSGEVKVETEDFPFAYYLNLIRYRVRENWRPPYQTLGENEKMTAIVGFRVLRNGRVEDITLESSSERFLFDQAAQRAIYAMGQLPPLPEEFGGEHLSVHIEFESVW